jgi:hypothetical protein
MIWVVHPGSQIPDPDPDLLPIPYPGSRGQKGIGSNIRICNTGFIKAAAAQLLRVPSVMPVMNYYVLWVHLKAVYSALPIHSL